MVGGYEYSDGVIDKVQFHPRALRADSPSYFAQLPKGAHYAEGSHAPFLL